jgi:hypothetical protein
MHYLNAILTPNTAAARHLKVMNTGSQGSDLLPEGKALQEQSSTKN